MRKAKEKKVREAGYRIVDTAEFLGLSNADANIITLRVALIRRLHEERNAKEISERDIAKDVNSEQSDIGRLDVKASNLTIDLILRELFALGVSREEIAEVIAAIT